MPFRQHGLDLCVNTGRQTAPADLTSEWVWACMQSKCKCAGEGSGLSYPLHKSNATIVPSYMCPKEDKQPLRTRKGQTSVQLLSMKLLLFQNAAFQD